MQTVMQQIESAEFLRLLWWLLSMDWDACWVPYCRVGSNADYLMVIAGYHLPERACYR